MYSNAMVFKCVALIELKFYFHIHHLHIIKFEHITACKRSKRRHFK